MGNVPEMLFRRHARNPVLHRGNWPYQANSVFNPAAAMVDGEVLLLVRVEDRRGISHLTVARSPDGANGWRIEPAPALGPQASRDEWGVEDPRITWMPEKSMWGVTYTEYSRSGPAVGLALTPDFKSFDRTAVSLGPDGKSADKDAALFPTRIDGRWAMIHRPEIDGTADIWISFSDDLREWTDSAAVLRAREGPWWDAGKVGLSPPPLETPDGWLTMYHGVKRTPAGSIYRLGLALLDIDDPTKVLHRADEWVFGPEAQYEMFGDVGNVVFPCGWFAIDDTVCMYYGAADTSVALATACLPELLDFVKQ